MRMKQIVIVLAISLLMIVSLTLTTQAQTVKEHVAVATVSKLNNIETTLQNLYDKYKNNKEGKVASYIPELAKVDPNYFGIAIVTVDGKIFASGDADIPFAIESDSKPFVYALALEDNGEKIMTEKIGLNATGRPFNSVTAIEEMPQHLQNPLVNAGAIQVTSAIKGKDSAEKWQRVLSFMQMLSDGKVFLGDKVYQSEMATNQRNRAIAELLNSYHLMYGDAADAVDRYTKACSVMVTVKQLALMGATLANNGINPLTHRKVISPIYIQDVLSQMAINGLYENSGMWWQKVGLPSKSGVGGSIVAIVPHQFAIAVFSPPLDNLGNSVRAQMVIDELSKQWHLHLLT